MTKEQLEKDLQLAKGRREQLIAEVNAVSGIIQYIEQSLKSEATSEVSETVKKEIENG